MATCDHVEAVCLNPIADIGQRARYVRLVQLTVVARFHRTSGVVLDRSEARVHVQFGAVAEDGGLNPMNSGIEFRESPIKRNINRKTYRGVNFDHSARK